MFAYCNLDGWYKSIWRFASNNKFKIKIRDNFRGLPLFRQNDVPLMTIFSITYKNSELETLNYVQNVLKAYSLADITTIDSKSISHLAFIVEESNGFRLVTWLRSLEIMRRMITAWQAALRSCFLNQYSIDR